MDGIKCLVLLLVIALCYQYSYSSSIYVGRHASGSRYTDGNEDCSDFDVKKCQKIIYWIGHKACKDPSTEYARTLSGICPKSCGLCGCKDVGVFCTRLSSLCNNNDATGKFLQQNCPKTCNTCQGVRGEASEFAALL